MTVTKAMVAKEVMWATTAGEKFKEKCGSHIILDNFFQDIIPMSANEIIWCFL